MARSKKYDNERFAKDLTAFFQRSGAENQDEFGALFGVSQNTAHLWLAGETFPLRDKRDKIREVAGIDINSYKITPSTNTTHGDRSHNIIGAPGSIQTVSESHFSEGPEPAPKKPTNNEMTAEQGIALKLMLKYWDSKLVQGCLSRLKQIDEELG